MMAFDFKKLNKDLLLRIARITSQQRLPKGTLRFLIMMI